VLAIAVSLLFMIAAGCAGRHRAKPSLGEVERLPRLECVNPTQHIDKNSLKVDHSYTATVETLEKVDLCARVQAGTTGLRGMRGFVKPIPKDVDIGLHVKAGQSLIELELPDLAADREVKVALLSLADNSFKQAEQAIQVAAAEIKEAEAQLE